MRLKFYNPLIGGAIKFASRIDPESEAKGSKVLFLAVYSGFIHYKNETGS
jgi:hypothetical protein